MNGDEEAPRAGGHDHRCSSCSRCSARAAATTKTTKQGSVQPQGDELRADAWARRTSPRRSSSVSCIARRCWRRAIKVKLRKDIGRTEVIDKELQSGRIDAYPEYLGVAVTVAAGQEDAGSTRGGDLRSWRRTSTPGAARRSASRRRSRTSTRSRPRSSSPSAGGWRPSDDLRQLSRFTLGARPEFEERQQGLAGMRAGLRARQRRVPGDPDRPAVPGTRPQQRSMPPTSSAPTASSASGSYKVLEDPSACSASSTWRS